MKKNPKMIAGIISIAVLAVGLAVMVFCLLIPKWREADNTVVPTATPHPPIPANVMTVTRDPSLPTAAPTLRRGSKGDEVKKLQNRLADLGYYHGTVDGGFGEQTETAVIAFQAQNGLDDDGIVGEETKAVLYSENAKPYAGN